MDRGAFIRELRTWFTRFDRVHRPWFGERDGPEWNDIFGRPMTLTAELRRRRAARDFRRRLFACEAFHRLVEHITDGNAALWLTHNLLWGLKDVLSKLTPEDAKQWRQESARAKAEAAIAASRPPDPRFNLMCSEPRQISRLPTAEALKIAAGIDGLLDVLRTGVTGHAERIFEQKGSRMNTKILGLLAMKSRFSMCLVMALIANGASLRAAQAQITTIDPNNFASGQVVTAPGVTLETETFVQTSADSSAPIVSGPVYSYNVGGGCTNNGYGSPCSVVGTSLFAPAPTGALPLPGNANWGIGGFWGDPSDGEAYNCSQKCVLNQGVGGSIVLRLDFAQPTDLVDVLAFFNGGDYTEITAFDSAGNRIGQDFDGVGSGAGWGYATIATGKDDISTVLIGGNDSFRAINEISYALVPEIDPTSAASGLALLLGGLVVLRGRRASLQ
jgi:hypothetical protein